jgi:hypothetical protein
MRSSIFILINLCLFFPCPGQVPVTINLKNILISELYPDPSPSPSLPEKEFVELYNNSSDTFSLDGFILSDGDKSCTFSAFTFLPEQYLILCKSADTALFSKYGTVYGFRSFISLNNDGDQVTLSSPAGRLIDQAKYGPSYQPGISLELVNQSSLCIIDNDNWKVCVNPDGGTPGRRNSVADIRLDTNLSAAFDIQIISDSMLQLNFDMALAPGIIQNAAFLIDEGNISCSPSFKGSEDKSILLKLNHDLIMGRFYSLEIQNVQACNGILFPKLNKEFLVPQQADSMDIIINEILFNPLPNQYDFVELYNRSSKYIDLKDWSISNSEMISTGSSKKICSHSFILDPGAYLILTHDAAHLLMQYPSAIGHTLLAIDLPAFADDHGSVMISDALDKISDLFHYNEDFHFPLLDSKEGVSLERISAQAPSDWKYNWHSAAGTKGYATPGYENSQQLRFTENEHWMIDPPSFSPDGDGYKDFTMAKYLLPNAGNISNIMVFDAQGRLIKNLLKNVTLETKGIIQWDGTTEEQTRAPAGQYIFFIQVYNLSGQVEVYKKPVVITMKE